MSVEVGIAGILVACTGVANGILLIRQHARPRAANWEVGKKGDQKRMELTVSDQKTNPGITLSLRGLLRKL